MNETNPKRRFGRIDEMPNKHFLYIMTSLNLEVNKDITTGKNQIASKWYWDRVVII